VASDPSRPSEEIPVEDGVISNRNSRSYADGAADKLLGLSGRKLKATEEEEDDAEEDLTESSETETENDTPQDVSPPTTPGPNTYLREAVPPEASQAQNTAIPHSASVAAQRGLQVSISAASNGRRASGLPASPRPTRMPFNTSNATPASPLTATTNSTR